MISFVRGILEEYTDEGIVVDVNGLGLAIAFPLTHRDRLPSPGEEVKIYTHYQVGEDAQKLYGFSLREERETFRLLIKVSGIGPKLAMSILSAVSLDELRIAVVTGDVKTLSRAPGLGTAYRFMALSICRLSSFSLRDSLLSYSFLPFATAISSLARPFSLRKSLVGTMVKPVSFVCLRILESSFLFSSSLRSLRGRWLL